MREIFLKILQMSISSSLLVLAVLLLRLVLKKAPKWVNVLLWGLVAVRLIVPVSFQSSFSLVPNELADGQLLSQIADSYLGQPETILVYDNNAADPQKNPVASFEVESGSLKPAKTVENTVFPVLGAIYYAGVALMILYTLVSFLLLRRKVATAVLLRDNIYQSEYVDSPFVLGVLKPKIYLPYRMGVQSQVHVIAHEQAHIRRKDHWWKPFGFVLLALHWFNPLMWLGYILLCRDIELACDEKVIKQMDSETKADYTNALVACSINRRRIAACPLAFGEVGVKARVKSVMNYKKPAFWIIAASIIICGVVAACFLTNPMDRFCMSKLKNDEINMPGILDDITDMVVTYEGVHIVCSEHADRNRFLATIDKIEVSADPISLDRSEDRDKDFTIMVNANTEIHFNKSFTEFWVDDHVKPSLSHRILNPGTAKELLLDFNHADSSVGSLKDPVIIVPNNHSQLRATVLEVHDSYLLVSPEGGTPESSTADKIEVSIKNKEVWPIPSVGDTVLIIYDGNVQETYPARIPNVYRVEIQNLDSNPVETVCGNFKIYFKNSDGTWQVGGRNYKYRLVITGRMHSAAVDSTFIYLSNLETITFDQAWKAAGFSSSTEDYFSADEAVLVEVYSADSSSITQTGGADKPANGEIVDSNGNVIKKTMTLEDVITLSKLGMALTWEDLKGYSGTETGSGLYIVQYDIDPEFFLLVGDGKTTDQPMYVSLNARSTGASCDIRKNDVEDFIAHNQNEALNYAIYKAILSHNADGTFPDLPNGPIPAESHFILGVESKSGTPLAGQSNHIEETTVYIQYVYHRYMISGGQLESVAASATPAKLTFSIDPEDGYTLKEFWQPHGGSGYAEEIRESFPKEIAEKVLDPSNDTVDMARLEALCLEKAKAYISKFTE